MRRKLKINQAGALKSKLSLCDLISQINGLKLYLSLHQIHGQNILRLKRAILLNKEAGETKIMAKMFSKNKHLQISVAQQYLLLSPKKTLGAHL